MARSFAAVMLAVTVATPAMAQQRDHRPANAYGGVHAPGQAPGHAAGQALTGAMTGDDISGPFGFSAHGAFRMMMQRQDFAPKVQLKTIVHGGATEAVGAAAGLRGEITMIDGKLLLTYGTPCADCGHTGMDHATLLASAKVGAWHPPITLPARLSGPALDTFIIEQARIHGLDLAKPFPLRMQGTLANVKMHVIKRANPNFKGHGSGHPMADMELLTGEAIDGDVVAFFAPEALQGVITHPREPFHYHWVDPARTRTAHLDAFALSEGAKLLLPLR